MTTEQILKKLITFKTISKNHEENDACLSWIKKQTKSLPIFTTGIRRQSFPSVVVTTRKTKRPAIWLAAHIDVVPGAASSFIPKQKGNRLYGRGTFDMKFAVACYIKLLQDLGSDLPRCNFGIMLTSDEEVGGANGAKYLVDKGYRSNVVILPDGGADWKIEKGAKGVLQLRVVSRGVSGHGSRPWSGRNAIVTLAEFLLLLQKEFVAEPCRDTMHRHATCNIGKIEGGAAINQIPDYAMAHVDIRLTSEKERKIVEKIVFTLQKRYKGIRVETEATGKSYQFDLGLPYFKRFSEVARKKYGIRTGSVFSHGSSDARFFAEKGIPVISTRPKGGGHHSEREWIDTTDLNRFYEVLKDFVKLF